MVARHYRKRVSISHIRQMAGTDREGTNLSGMVKAAEKLGFSAKAFRSSPPTINHEVPVPFIAHVVRESVHHYVVVHRFVRNAVMVADPAQGLIRMPNEEFLAWWTGAVLLLVPDEGFEISGPDLGPLARFVPLIVPHAGTLVEVFLASLLLIVLGLGNFFYFRFLIDEILPAGMESSLHLLSIGMVGLLLIQALLGAVRSYALSHLGNKVDLTILLAYFRHLLKMPLEFFDSRKVGEILTRLDDAAKIRSVLSGTSLSVLMDLVLMFGVGTFLFFQSVPLTLLALATVPFSVALVWVFSPLFRRHYQKLMALGARTHSHMVERMNGIFTVKSMNAEDLTFWQGEQNLLQNTLQSLKLQNLGNLQGALMGFVDGMGTTLLFWMGGWLILQNQLTLGQLISFQVLMGYFTGPIKRLVSLQPSLQEALVAATRIGEILDLSPEQSGERTWVRPEKLLGRIELQGVRFRYGSRRWILDGFNLTIEPGTRVALVGGSGSGKSTLVKLLMKFYLPEEGTILLDGIDLRDIEAGFLRARVGYVPQEVALFSGTIRENIALHVPMATMERIVEAAMKSQAHGFINQLPDRYETLVGERGASLSGGERQRIALARALLGRPEILIFDEATSALDTVTERAIQTTIEALTEARVTTLIVAHRLSTIRSCDQIVVLSGGQVMEAGTHEELIAKGGAYAALWGEQTP